MTKIIKVLTCGSLNPSTDCRENREGQCKGCIWLKPLNMGKVIRERKITEQA